MEKYLLCGELSLSPSRSEEEDEGGGTGASQENGGRMKVYKGRRRGTVEFCGIWKHSKAVKDLIANGVRVMHFLDHQNVLRFCEWYETPKHIWVITELASGGSLAEIIEQDGCIPAEKLGGFVSDLASGLHYLHSTHILYCDLQPRKVVLDTCECLKLSDFTLARSSQTPSPHPGSSMEQSFRSDASAWFELRQQQSSQSRSKVEKHSTHHEIPQGWGSPELDSSIADYLPSPFYASPEVFVGSEFSMASDLWSLGCVVFEMLTGEQPFCGASLEEVEGAVCEGGREGWGKGYKVFGEWKELVYGLLIKSPKQRWTWVEARDTLETTDICIGPHPNTLRGSVPVSAFSRPNTDYVGHSS